MYLIISTIDIAYFLHCGVVHNIEFILQKWFKKVVNFNINKHIYPKKFVKW